MIQVYDKYGKIKESGTPGAGTITNFSAGNLSPLFNTTVTSPTSTPNLSFSAISQAQNLFYASPNGSSGVPTFRALVAADIPTLTNYVPTSRTLTINGVTYDLSANRSWTIAAGVSSVTATAPLTSSGGATPDISTSMNTNKLIGRSTAGVGVMEEITIGSGLTLSGGTLSSTATGGSIPHATAAGTDTYTATITGVTSYADGDAYLIRFPNGNTTGATLNINSLGAIPLYRNNDGPLIGGDILSGAEMLCVYNSSLNIFQAIGTAPNTLLGYVTNADSVTITKGQVVYAFGGQGDRMTVKLANNTSDATSARTVGVVLSTSIAANQRGIIIMQGLLDGLSILPTATYSDGDPIYLGATSGSITNVKPYAPNHLVYVATVTTASNGSAGRMYVNIQNGYELDELHNVQAQSPALKDTLWYDNTVSPAQWKTASIATILGYTPGTVSSVAALTLGTSGTDLSSTVANGTTTPVITLDVPTASASNRGVLSPTDWSTFNNKQNNLRTFNTTQGIYYFEEFLGQSRHVDFGIGNNQGSSAYTATITNRTNQQGVVQHNTNANSTGQAGFTFVNGAFQFIGGGVITLEEYVNITTLSTLAERFYTFFGYVTGANFANIPNTIVITYDEGGVFLSANASPNFKCVTRAGSTATTTITSIPIVAGQWYKLKIIINAIAPSVEFYIDNVLVATHTTNIPLTTTAMYIANGIAKNTGTTARSMQTDYFMYEQIFTNPR